VVSRSAEWLALAVVLSPAACASIAGLQDVPAEDGGSAGADGTVPTGGDAAGADRSIAADGASSSSGSGSDGSGSGGPTICTIGGQCVAPGTCAGGALGGAGLCCEDAGALLCGAQGAACCPSNRCVANAACQGGTCVACGGTGQPCCPQAFAESGCANGQCCDPGTVTCVAVNATCSDGTSKCGTAGGRSLCGCGLEPQQPCCANATCLAGMKCVAGSCAECGLSGAPCCDGNACGQGSCNTTTGMCDTDAGCGGCGGPGQACCAGSTCSLGHCCDPSGACVSADSKCSNGTLCIGGVCCGAPGAACCAGPIELQCPLDGGFCDGGTCQ
jgi:hypothetical protein